MSKITEGNSLLSALKSISRIHDALIDSVVIIADAGSRDLNSVYRLIKEVLVPCGLGSDRVVIALNKCDTAGEPGDFDYTANEPTEALKQDLDNMVLEIQNRVKEETGWSHIEVVYYAAGFTKRDGTKQPSYNLNKLLYSIITHIPNTKRLVIAQNTNNEELKRDTDKEGYGGKVENSIWDTIGEYASGALGFIKEVASNVIIEGGSWPPARG